MTANKRIALAQINTTVGDFPGNLERIRAAARDAGRAGACLVVFPELTLCGYMPRDLLEEDSFLDACEASVRVLAAARDLPPLLVGAPWRANGRGKPIVNAAVLLAAGREPVVVAKRLLPTYDVFDERRYFRPGPPAVPVDVGGMNVGVTICEDAWEDEGGLYDENPVEELVRAGASVIVNLSASPYARGKPAFRRALLRAHALGHRVPVALCNLVGANDQLVFDGNSFLFDADGALRAHAAAFAEDLVVADVGAPAAPAPPPAPPADDLKDAIVLGIADYFRKTGFSDAIVGMSGGVDSSLVACLATEALGAGHVTGVGMPGPFSAAWSLDDARTLAVRLGVRFLEFPITGAYHGLSTGLRALWGDRPFDVAEENLQARLRGLVLMSLANKTRALVLVPSNKSEFAMGYCTLYGDMVGALAPVSDLYKGEVYALARRYDMPARTLARAPSAELREGQTDRDTLPPYDVLDEILRLHLEERLRPAAIAARGFERTLVDRVLRTVARAEYKRQQAAPVLKVTGKAFGLAGRRFPIVERFDGGASCP